MINIFKKYRVLKNEYGFIAQCKINDYWRGIDKDKPLTWHTIDNQKEYCLFDNLQDAKEHLEKYKNKNKKLKTIKYYY